jgi:hypothetical protein
MPAKAKSLKVAEWLEPSRYCVIASDDGPGIADVRQALRDGFPLRAAWGLVCREAPIDGRIRHYFPTLAGGNNCGGD